MINQRIDGRLEIIFHTCGKENLDLLENIESAFYNQEEIEIAGLKYICNRFEIEAPLQADRIGEPAKITAELTKVNEELDK